MRILSRFHRFVADVQSIDHQPVEGGFRMFADRAYARLTEWFGVPEDADWDYEIIRGPLAKLCRDPIRRLYIIVIRRNDTAVEDQFASITHEMYHRVTLRRKGLNRKVWVDEILAYLSTQRFVREEGMTDYADAEMKSLCTQKLIRLSLKEFKSVKRKPNLLGLLGSAYPPGFAETTAILGGTLEAVVEWDDLCRMVACQTWEEWMSLLPSKTQRLVRGALNNE